MWMNQVETAIPKNKQLVELLKKYDTKLFHSSNMNMIFLLTRKADTQDVGDKLILRISQRQRGVDYSDIVSKIGGIIGPRIVLQAKDRSQHFQVEEFIKGVRLNKSQETIKLIARKLFELHSLDHKKKFTPKPDCYEYVYKILEKMEKGNNQYQKALGGVIRLFLSKRKFFDIFIEGNHSLSIIHGDARPSNIVMKGQKIRLIDWDLATYDDPAIDVAKVFVLGKFDSKERKEFFDCYLCNQFGKHFKERVSVYIFRTIIYEIYNYLKKSTAHPKNREVCNAIKQNISFLQRNLSES